MSLSVRRGTAVRCVMAGMALLRHAKIYFGCAAKGRSAMAGADSAGILAICPFGDGPSFGGCVAFSSTRSRLGVPTGAGTALAVVTAITVCGRFGRAGTTASEGFMEIGCLLAVLAEHVRRRMGSPIIAVSAGYNVNGRYFARIPKMAMLVGQRGLFSCRLFSTAFCGLTYAGYATKRF